MRFKYWKTNKMSYREDLKTRILKIQKRMSEDNSEKLELEIELNKLKLTEFEEDMKEEQEQKLLKGQCCFYATVVIDNLP